MVDLLLPHDRPSDQLDDLGHDRVSEATQSVHPRGNPMSHSTHVGFSCPPTIAAASSGVSAFAATICRPADPEFMALLLCPWQAVGVGHIVAAIASTNDPLRFFLRKRSAMSGVSVDATHLSAVGVGNIFT
jgi:hypothetical protein